MKTLHDRVFDALSSVFPKPISQLVEETGLAYSTVRDHLDQMRAVRIEGPPVRYMRPMTDEKVIPVHISPQPQAVRAWRAERANIAERVRTITVSEYADPVWLADQFIELGKHLMEIGISIDRVKVDPDWYQKLGGRTWLS